MCSLPPAPPPPPPPLPPNFTSPKITLDNTTPPSHDSVCEWALPDLSLWEVCARNQICLNKAPYQYKYKHFKSIMQQGPTCGLVALSMLLDEQITPEELMNIAKQNSFSNNGEMFSCNNMAKLAQYAITLINKENINFCVKMGGLFSEEVILELLNDNSYDADFNHAPCLRNGHTAHWALVCGIIIVSEPSDSYISDPNNVYVLCKHGKSRYLTAWSLSVLDKSNKNLWEFSPKKQQDGLIYTLPEGGIGGENGIRDQFLIFYGL
ncbi:unnamed protein product [Danaus chrysippus]|uniref:Actin maturation protease n=1 Tax=Danaus chrysippus TaxID=151541 RepID=A0A8J2QM27_9NEOP|nr:unnamed protein product [Danaus chrysippus]